MTPPFWKSVAEIENRNGILFLEGCDVRSLAKEFGTPLYVYSESRIRSNYRRLVKAYKNHYHRFKVYFAIKSNSNPAIIKILESEGCGADAACIAEIEIAKSAGIPANEILYSGVYNSFEDLCFAVKNQLLVNMEDLSQLERLKEIGVPKSLCFRLNPSFGASGKEGLVFSGKEAKFGISEEKIERAYTIAKEMGVEKFGIHMMTGSNILSEEYFIKAVEKLLDIAGPIAKKLGITFDFIDIGGSLGVPYHPDEKELDIDAVANGVVRAFREKLSKYQMGEPFLIHEPGRFLVSDAGILLSTVTSIKEGDKRFIGLDAGMNTLLRPALYGAYHHFLQADNLNADCDKQAHIVGRVCENTDIFAKDRFLPSDTKPGDLFAILNTGAYGFCMSSHYNSQPRAAEVLVSNGKAELIRERESFEHLIHGTRLPKHLRK